MGSEELIHWTAAHLSRPEQYSPACLSSPKDSPSLEKPAARSLAPTKRKPRPLDRSLLLHVSSDLLSSLSFLDFPVAFMGGVRFGLAMAGGRPGRRPDLGDGEVDRQTWARPLGLPSPLALSLSLGVCLPFGRAPFRVSDGRFTSEGRGLCGGAGFGVRGTRVGSGRGGVGVLSQQLRDVQHIEDPCRRRRGGGKRDPSKPYSLGPRISDWDEQRAEWLRNNPDFPDFIRPNKPRVLLVTGSSPKPCENPVGDHYLLKSIKNKIDYCRVHGIEIFYNMALLDAEMAGFWAKLPLIRKLLLSHPEIEFLWWMDSDAMFTDMAFEVPWERYKDSNFVLHGWNEMVYDQKNWIGLNTGSFLLRNCQWSLDLLDVWAPMGPKGKIREEAGKILTRELKDRPVFEADDQSAMVYLLATQRDRWGEKVYLESGYYLHGYWGILVDRYEEMIENYHPGLGDHRWPLVTHFVGCNRCGKFGDYPVERCLKQMDRV
ncbi:hypothetical protein NL676_007421 [Syzygium grande]|nr:hypothetical protein NL676_007421 [Syzygium grande]